MKYLLSEDDLHSAVYLKMVTDMGHYGLIRYHGAHLGKMPEGTKIEWDVKEHSEGDEDDPVKSVGAEVELVYPKPEPKPKPEPTQGGRSTPSGDEKEIEYKEPPFYKSKNFYIGVAFATGFAITTLMF